MQQAALFRRQTANKQTARTIYLHNVESVFVSEIWASALADPFASTVFCLRESAKSAGESAVKTHKKRTRKEQASLTDRSSPLACYSLADGTEVAEECSRAALFRRYFILVVIVVRLRNQRETLVRISLLNLYHYKMVDKNTNIIFGNLNNFLYLCH